MTRMFDLPHHLVGEKILAKVPITSLKAVRSTCKLLNALSKEFLVGKAITRQHEFLGFTTIGDKVYSLRFNLQGIRKDNELVHPTIKEVALPNQVKIFKVFHCEEGLVLCVTKDKLVVWNPYLGKTRWIEPRKYFHKFEIYALGYDNNRNHKILRLCTFGESVDFFEIYDFDSDSWKILDVIPGFEIEYYQRGVTLKGNTYFFAKVTIYQHRGNGDYLILSLEDFLICFDFTRERFGQRLPLPFNSYADETVTLSCVREEQLAVLYERWDPSTVLEIWVTNKIEPNTVSWSKFLVMDMTTLNDNLFQPEASCFFIDEEKKVVVVFDVEEDEPTRYQTAYIIGEDGYFKSVRLEEETSDVRMPRYYPPIVTSSYHPSLVQIKKQGKRKRNRKERDA